jgi:cell division protein FtsW
VIGKRINGSRRWIGIGGQTLQPSEFGKLAAVVALAWWFSRKETISRAFKDGFIYPLALAGVMMALIAPEVDLGTTSLIGGTALVMMFVAGTRIPYLAIVVVSGFTGLYGIVKAMPERSGRLMAFLHPKDFPDDAYQQLQGLIAFGNGGVDGLGLGNGRQKFGYLPYAHTDFIFPTVGEELGMVFTLLVVTCFLLVLLAGAVIAVRASDRFGMLLGFGLVTLLALQAALNIGVVTMWLPNKGLPLPFISYGGSNLAFCLGTIGVLISIYRHGNGERSDPDAILFQSRLKRRKTPRI